MGVKSTLDITREEAITYIMDNISLVSNEVLSDMVENMNDGFRKECDWDRTLGLHNFRIERNEE